MEGLQVQIICNKKLMGETGRVVVVFWGREGGGVGLAVQTSHCEGYE